MVIRDFLIKNVHKLPEHFIYFLVLCYTRIEMLWDLSRGLSDMGTFWGFSPLYVTNPVTNMGAGFVTYGGQ